MNAAFVAAFPTGQTLSPILPELSLLAGALAPVQTYTAMTLKHLEILNSYLDLLAMPL